MKAQRDEECAPRDEGELRGDRERDGRDCVVWKTTLERIAKTLLWSNLHR